MTKRTWSLGIKFFKLKIQHPSSTILEEACFSPYYFVNVFEENFWSLLGFESLQPLMSLWRSSAQSTSSDKLVLNVEEIDLKQTPASINE